MFVCEPPCRGNAGRGGIVKILAQSKHRSGSSAPQLGRTQSRFLVHLQGCDTRWIFSPVIVPLVFSLKWILARPPLGASKRSWPCPHTDTESFNPKLTSIWHHRDEILPPVNAIHWFLFFFYFFCFVFKSHLAKFFLKTKTSPRETIRNPKLLKESGWNRRTPPPPLLEISGL